MKQSFVAKNSVTIQIDADRMWEALTNPELIKQYLFRTEPLESTGTVLMLSIEHVAY